MAESVVTENVEFNKEVTGSAEIDKHVKEVGRIRLHAQDKGHVLGMVVYHQRVYVVHFKGLIVYCYTPDGSLSHKYEHKDGEEAYVWGMCLMKDGDTAMLVVSDGTSKSLIWIKITDNVTMDHHHTQQLDYSPRGSCIDKGDLMVCDPDNDRIHRYRHDGQSLAVINLPDDVYPRWVARHDNQYIVSDTNNDQVVMIDNKGQVKTRYKDDIQGVELSGPSGVIIDPEHRGVLIGNFWQHQVLLLRKTGDVVTILDEHVTCPRLLYLDTDHHRLYVSGEDDLLKKHVFIFIYTLLTVGKSLTRKINKLNI